METRRIRSGNKADVCDNSPFLLYSNTQNPSDTPTRWATVRSANVQTPVSCCTALMPTRSPNTCQHRCAATPNEVRKPEQVRRRCHVLLVS